MISTRTQLKANRFRDLARQARKSAARLNVRNAEAVAKDYREHVHVITGKTRESIGVEVDRRTGSAKVVAGEGAVYEELGTVYRPPHPALMPAVERQKRRMQSRRVQMYR